MRIVTYNIILYLKGVFLFFVLSFWTCSANSQTTHLAPQPPGVADDDNIQHIIEQTQRCSDTQADRGILDRTLGNTHLVIGGKSWQLAQEQIKKYIAKRIVARDCIMHLDAVRFSATMNEHDRIIVKNAEKQLSNYWNSQSFYDSKVLGYLVDIKTPDEGIFFN